MKINDSKKVIVIGHKSPDTDSICSAIAYANLKNQMDDGLFYVPCRAGDMNLETQYVLDRFGVAAPERLYSVATQVEDLEIDDIVAIPEQTSMRSAWKAMREVNEKSQPIVDGEGMLSGMVTLNDIAKGNMDNMDPAVLAVAKTPMKNVLEVLHGTILCGDAEAVLEEGKILVGAGGADQVRAKIEKAGIVVLGGQEDAQMAAIEGGAGVLVLSLGCEASPEVLEAAKSAGTIIVKTDFDSYACARLIAQSAPVKAFMTGTDELVGFKPDTLVDDVRSTITDSRHISFPVSTQDGKYIGVIGKGSLLTATGKKMILVDHNEKTQCVDGFEQAQILEIVDHHKIGNIETTDPIQFVNKPVGCTSTILYGMYQEAGVEIDPTMAGLMLSAILSDTLDFRSPTCTSKDVNAAEALAKIAGVEPHAHALEMFGAGESIEGRTPEDVCYQDFKIFTKGDIRFGVGQGSFMSPVNIQKAIELLKPYLDSTLEKDKTNMVFFMATNIGEQSSRVIYAGDEAQATIEAAFGVKQSADEDGVLLPGVVSRKKQMIPSILEALK